VPDSSADVLRVPLRVPLTRPRVVSGISAELWMPSSRGSGPALILAHGAGTDRSNALLVAVARGLSGHGVPVLLFNFPYTETPGRRPPDPMPALESCYGDVRDALRARLGDRPVVLGGRSMGGRVASHLAAQGVECAGLLFLGYPLHPPRRAGVPITDERLRTAHWEQLRVPMLFVQGDRDALADLALLQRERAARLAAAASTVHVVAGGDHGFAVRKRDGRTPDEVLEEIIDVTHDWLRSLAGAPAARP
jgi:predicted alpha/beta-hydrolase family hydrolase